MVNSVTHQVYQRIGQLVDDAAIEFGFLAVQFKLDFLAEFAGQITCQARIFLEQAADRLHARAHRRALQIADQMIEFIHRFVEHAHRIDAVIASVQIAPQAQQTVFREADLP